MDGNEKLYDFLTRSNETALVCKDPSLAVQSQAEDADINVIIARFGLTGELPTDIRMPTSQDFGDNVFDYQSAMHIIIDAQKQFARLPADLRARFDHDPQAFMDFVHDPANGGELVRLGLRNPPAAEAKPASDGSAAAAPNASSPAG